MRATARLLLPRLRQQALTWVGQVRTLIARLDLVHRQLSVSLYRTRVRCGKASCHCAQGPGHPGWALGFRDKAGQHTRAVSGEQARILEPRVAACRRYRHQRAELAKVTRTLLALVDRMQKLLLDRYRLQASRRKRS
jgi:hypothetical protein